jgi:glycosyltransferase involved in cell wall biosynthesis
VRPHEATGLDTLLIRFAFLAPTDFIVHAESDLHLLRELKPRAKVFKMDHPTYEVFRAGEGPDSLQARRMLGIEGNLLLFFGYVRRYKGLEYLLRALPKVLQEVDCTLLVVGEIYEEGSKFRQMIDQLRLSDCVRLIDRYIPNEQVGLYFEAADAVVLPYISATQSGIIQIAYGFRKPVITTRVGGVPEVVSDGETGFLTEPGNPEALAETILRFYRCRSVIDFTGNIEKFRERFAWGKLVKGIEQIHGMA